MAQANRNPPNTPKDPKNPPSCPIDDPLCQKQRVIGHSSSVSYLPPVHVERGYPPLGRLQFNSGSFFFTTFDRLAASY